MLRTPEFRGHVTGFIVNCNRRQYYNRFRLRSKLADDAGRIHEGSRTRDAKTNAISVSLEDGPCIDEPGRSMLCLHADPHLIASFV